MSELSVISSVIKTLNTIPVAGKREMSKMLGCIAALESVVEALQKPVEKEEESNG